MKIASVTTAPCVLRQEDKDWAFARAAIPEVRGVIITITDDEGRTGLGYGNSLPSVTGTAEGVQAAIDFLGPRLIGRDPADLKAVLADIDQALIYNPSAKAGLEMALYDLVARRLGTSVGTLLGGRYRTRIPQSRLIPLKSPEAMAAKAAALVAEGYRTVKLKLSGEPKLDTARIAASRKAVGPDVTITLDPNMSYSAKGFLRAYEQFSLHDIALVEQPVPARDLDGLRQITRALPIPVEADESAGSVADVLRLATERIVDVVNVKPTKLGGVQNTLAAIAICDAAGVGCKIGAAMGPALLQAFHAHVAATIPRLEHACELAEHLHLLDDPFTPLPSVDGMIEVPTGPGTGVTLRGA